MDHVFAGQAARRSISWLRMADRAMRLHPGIGFVLDHSPPATHDHTRHTTAVLKLAVSRVDNRVDRLLGDITLYDLNFLPRGEGFLSQDLVHGWIVAFPQKAVNEMRLFLDYQRYPIFDHALFDDTQAVFIDLCDHLINLLFQNPGEDQNTLGSDQIAHTAIQ